MDWTWRKIMAQSMVGGMFQILKHNWWRIFE